MLSLLCFPRLLPCHGLILSPIYGKASVFSETSWHSLSHTVIHTASYHWTNFLKTLLLLSHSNSLGLHFLIDEMDMFMFFLLAYLISLLKGSNKLIDGKVPCKLKNVVYMSVHQPILGTSFPPAIYQIKFALLGPEFKAFIIKHVPNLLSLQSWFFSLPYLPIWEAFQIPSILRNLLI